MIRVTLDTNVLVSGSFWTGHSFKILEKIDKCEISCILSKEILDEYNKTIKSDEIMEKIENKSLILSKTLKRIIANSIIVEPSNKINAVHDDPDDNKIIECAVAGKVNYIITNDNHLLKLKEYSGIKIITPSNFLKYIL